VWPNLFTAARVQRPALSTAAYYSWPPLAQLLPRQSLNESVLQSCRSCDECLAVEPRLVHHFAASLRRAQFGLSWIYLDALDECGHAHGGNSPAYPALVAKVDGWVGTVLEARRSAGIADSTHGSGVVLSHMPTSALVPPASQTKAHSSASMCQGRLPQQPLHLVIWFAGCSAQAIGSWMWP